MQRDTLDVLEDIREAADFIVADTVGATFESFMEDRRMRQLVQFNFMVIGEAVNRLSRHDLAAIGRISAYERIVAFRNILIHGYDAVDYEIVWLAVQESLPVLRSEVEALLQEGES